MNRAPDQTELQQDLEDANAQLVVERKLVIKYWKQVTQILRLTEGRTGTWVEEIKEKEDKGNDIARFLGANRAKLQGWKVQLALKLVGKGNTCNTEQK